MNWMGVKNVGTKWIPEVITSQIIAGLTGTDEEQSDAWGFLTSDLCQLMIECRLSGGVPNG